MTYIPDYIDLATNRRMIGDTTRDLTTAERITGLHALVHDGQPVNTDITSSKQAVQVCAQAIAAFCEEHTDDASLRIPAMHLLRARSVLSLLGHQDDDDIYAATCAGLDVPLQESLHLKRHVTNALDNLRSEVQ